MSEPHATAPAHDAPHPEHHGEHHEEHPHVNYWLVFVALCVLTGLSVAFDEIRAHLNWGALVLMVLSVATCKALCVMMYFMHLKFEGGWKYVLLAPTIILALAIPTALMPDIGSHYYDVQVPQSKYADVAQTPHGGESGHGGAADAPPEAEHQHTKH